jgi:regulator of cell morphogenesis and NO signaling
MNELTVKASLADDHDRLDHLLESYRQLKRVDFARAKQAFREFKFGLQRHILQEENVLFPLFEEKTGMRDHGPTLVMRAEHREIGKRLEALHAWVRAGDVDSDREEASLVEALFAHNHKEENALYPALDRLLSEAEKADAFRKMEELPEEAYRTCCGRRHETAAHEEAPHTPQVAQ